jgi:hypothetical protein
MTRTKSNYRVRSNGDLELTTIIPIEGLTGAKREKAVWDAIDALLDCLNEFQHEVGLELEVIDPRKIRKKRKKEGK